MCGYRKNILSGESERIESTSLFNNLFNIHEMVMWSPSQTGGFPPGTPVSSHKDHPNANIGANEHD